MQLMVYCMAAGVPLIATDARLHVHWCCIAWQLMSACFLWPHWVTGLLMLHYMATNAGLPGYWWCIAWLLMLDCMGMIYTLQGTGCLQCIACKGIILSDYNLWFANNENLMMKTRTLLHSIQMFVFLQIVKSSFPRIYCTVCLNIIQ
jgi:hypothetical protein